mmetsp:Transcript_31456/g.65834  ORF Transcript_31456/g.65834 Transcript_31456/m.65834 type:complete len:432 (+) Transcript_31456:143-1438(+)
MRHGAKVKDCSHEGCTNKARSGLVCVRHGAKVSRKPCSHEGCTNHAKVGGVCIKHGAKRPFCTHLGCTTYAVKGGLCIRHGAKIKKCVHEGCTSQARNGLVCARHGAKVNRKRCSHKGCMHYSRNGGVCTRHGAGKSKTLELSASPQMVHSQRPVSAITKEIDTPGAQSKPEIFERGKKDADKRLNETVTRWKKTMVGVNPGAGMDFMHTRKVSQYEAENSGNTYIKTDIGLKRNTKSGSFADQIAVSKDGHGAVVETAPAEMKMRTSSNLVFGNLPAQVHPHPQLGLTSFSQATKLAPPSITQPLKCFSLSMAEAPPSSFPSLNKGLGPPTRISYDQAQQLPSREPRKKTPQPWNLGPEAKRILREIVHLAVLHPHGKVDPDMLRRVMREGGVSKGAVMNAVTEARMRLRRNVERRLEQKIPRTREMQER